MFPSTYLGKQGVTNVLHRNFRAQLVYDGRPLGLIQNCSPGFDQVNSAVTQRCFLILSIWGTVLYSVTLSLKSVLNAVSSIILCHQDGVPDRSLQEMGYAGRKRLGCWLRESQPEKKSNETILKTANSKMKTMRRQAEFLGQMMKMITRTSRNNRKDRMEKNRGCNIEIQSLMVQQPSQDTCLCASSTDMMMHDDVCVSFPHLECCVAVSVWRAVSHGSCAVERAGGMWDAVCLPPRTSPATDECSR